MAPTSELQRRFWARSRRVALWLLSVWSLVSIAVPWFAGDLQEVHGFGFPLGFWLAAQGTLLVYLAIIVADIVVMERLEARYRQDAAAEGGAAAGIRVKAAAAADVDVAVDGNADAETRPPSRRADAGRRTPSA